jgi:hypothetical protein
MGSRLRDAWASFGHIQGIVTLFQWGHWYFIAGGATLIGTILSGFFGAQWGALCTLISAPSILVCLTCIILLRDRSRRDIELNAFRRAGAKLLNERLFSASALADWVARVTTWTDQTAAEIQKCYGTTQAEWFSFLVLTKVKYQSGHALSKEHAFKLAHLAERLLRLDTILARK